ncbi:M48 family metallopeptidase [Roseateles koreensis]|uniref:SprT family zinc-dependent metalloprotease n=1 Tax=Roseateles koreensis TaxID=2987526 RepID=A0ABT5KVR8_9BURK|nr:SprT family zinc-dependent metalloprotease [Roseateles koreensis]MDC8786515.1 SprT family zinc-dependent metalloprotease [Roseateles koreensis]
MRKRLAHLLQEAQLSLFGPETVLTPPRDSQMPPKLTPKQLPPVLAPETPHTVAPKTQREMCLGEHRVVYELKRARRRSIGFVVGADGLRVSAPRWVPQADIERALLLKSDWILRKLVEQRERARRVQEARIEWRDGASLSYLGRALQLRLDASQSGARFDEAQGILTVGLPPAATQEQVRDVVQAWLQRRARAWFEPRCQHFAAALGVQMKSLRLSSAQTRWGSASADGSIRLNWRLIHFTPAIIDYVVAHELAHLREMNHSARFWAVVRSVVPDFEQARGQLRQESIIAE